MQTSDEAHKHQERAYADAHAAAYLHEMYQGPWPHYRARIEERVRALRPRPGCVLDVGCGPIPSLPGLYGLADRFVGVDHSIECVRRLRRQYPSAEAIVGDVEDLPAVLTESFDVAVVLGVLHHVPHPQRVVAGVRALLVPGGLVVAMEPNEGAAAGMDSPCERPLPDATFDAVYQDFTPLERWSWFDWGFWVAAFERMPAGELISAWPRPEAWADLFAQEAQHLAQGGRPSMNVLIARKP